MTHGRHFMSLAVNASSALATYLGRYLIWSQLCTKRIHMIRREHPCVYRQLEKAESSQDYLVINFWAAQRRT